MTVRNNNFLIRHHLNNKEKVVIEQLSTHNRLWIYSGGIFLVYHRYKIIGVDEI
jgi:hypothetical protein